MKLHITKTMVKNGLKKGVIKPMLEDVGLTCHIGENWFFYGGSEFELTEPSEIPFDTNVTMIKATLDAFNCYAETVDEYLYYYWYLVENGCK